MPALTPAYCAGSRESSLHGWAQMRIGRKRSCSRRSGRAASWRWRAPLWLRHWSRRPPSTSRTPRRLHTWSSSCKSPPSKPARPAKPWRRRATYIFRFCQQKENILENLQRHLEGSTSVYISRHALKSFRAHVGHRQHAGLETTPFLDCLVCHRWGLKA